jgi:DNA-binding HxlR family transcriptional regulator
MRSKGFDGMVCSIAGVLAAIGDRWGALILRDLTFGLSRFEDFRRSTGVTNATLSDRLKELERHGLIERRRYQESPERFEYHLTEMGWEIVPVMIALAELGDRWGASGADGPPVAFINRRTGAAVKTALIDQETGERLAARDLRAKEGPGADDLVRFRLSKAQRLSIPGDQQ